MLEHSFTVTTLRADLLLIQSFSRELPLLFCLSWGFSCLVPGLLFFVILWPTLFPQGTKPSVMGPFCWKRAESHSVIFSLNNSAMNLLLLFYKIIAVGKGFEDHAAFCNIYPWGWNEVLANLGSYNLLKCSLDFIFDILNLGLSPKFQETRPKDLEGHFLNYQRSLQWGKLFPSTLTSCLLVPPWF